MARDEAAPFARGETYYNGEAIDINNLGGPNLEGKEFLFEVNAPDDTTKGDPTGRPVRVKVVRNVSGAALKGGRIAHFKTLAGVPLETVVDGYTFAESDLAAGVIDEFLPPNGVPTNDLFYLVIEGPTTVYAVDAGLTAVAVGDRLVPGTGTSLVSANSGKVNKSPGAAYTDAVAVFGLAETAQAVASGLIKTVVHFPHR